MKKGDSAPEHEKEKAKVKEVVDLIIKLQMHPMTINNLAIFLLKSFAEVIAEQAMKIPNHQKQALADAYRSRN